MSVYSIVIGIYPTSAQTAAIDFVNDYLNGLSVSAYEVDFASPNPVASVQPPGNLIGTASFSGGSIYQLRTRVGIVTEPAAAAAAVIEIPAALASQFVDPAGDPFTTPANPLINVVLGVERNGIAIADDSINYDCSVATDPPRPD
jgi:hypothetical protein